MVTTIDPSLHRRRIVRLLGWLSGLLLLGGLVSVTLHLTELERFVVLLERARPIWLLSGMVLQAGTYLCAARVLQRSLSRQGVQQQLSDLIPLSLAKLFTDHAVPTVGLSGTLLTIRGLERRGIPRGISIGAILTSLAAHYIAYSLIVALALLLLWWRNELTLNVLFISTVFGIVVATVPIAMFWLRGSASQRLPGWLTRLLPIREALAALSEAPSGLLHEHRLISELVILQATVFLLDAVTLGAMLLALAVPAEPDVVFASFVLASVVATLGCVPGGLGTFDATCVAILHWHGVALEAALAATLLQRGLTFWLPMIPGLWLARHELRLVNKKTPAR